MGGDICVLSVTFSQSDAPVPNSLSSVCEPLSLTRIIIIIIVIVVIIIIIISSSSSSSSSIVFL